jgi:Rrf2 family transcriptional regulator, nitric oxide-sensitive transcriptional repressor
MSSVIKISEACSLALHAMVMMAANPAKKFSTHEMAQKLKASEAHLSKVMQRLVKTKLVTSGRGPKGGFELASDPDKITLMDIFEAIEGPLSESHCLVGQPVCGRMNCIMGDILNNVNNELRKYLSETSLAMLKEECELKE